MMYKSLIQQKYKSKLKMMIKKKKVNYMVEKRGWEEHNNNDWVIQTINMV